MIEKGSKMDLQQAVLEVRSLRVSYRSVVAVDQVDLWVKPGQCLGLLGPNGAGKTTTLRAILGMVKPDSGKVQVNGFRPGSLSALRSLGFAPEDGSAPEFLTGDEFLHFSGNIRGVDRSKLKSTVKDLLTEFELDPRKRAAAYSKGMQRRLLLAQAFLGPPRILILDEPLNGLDPLIIIKLRERILSYVKSGGAVIFSSHILTEVERTCSDIIILNRGRVAVSGTTDQLIKKFGSVEEAFVTCFSGT